MAEITYYEGDDTGALVSRTVKVSKRATRRWPLASSLTYSHVLGTPLGHVRPCVVMRVDTPDGKVWLLATLTVPGIRSLVLRIKEEAAVRWLMLNGDKVPADVSARVTVDAPFCKKPEAAYIEAAPPLVNGMPEARTEPPDLVTLDKAAAAVHRSKRTLERYKTKGTLPKPAVVGGGGKPDLYDWVVMRPWLIKEFGVTLPQRYWKG